MLRTYPLWYGKLVAMVFSTTDGRIVPPVERGQSFFQLSAAVYLKRKSMTEGVTVRRASAFERVTLFACRVTVRPASVFFTLREPLKNSPSRM